MIRRTRVRGDLKAQGQPGLERLSHVAENYLLCLYMLREEGRRATAAQLAEDIRHLPAGEGLGTSLPTILGMLRRMAREGLVEVSVSKEIHLTEKGDGLAQDMVRRHRLAERMVVDLLGLELHRAHIEAHRLEHALSPEVEARIAARLGNPTTCPFGRPIPGSAYQPPPGEQLTLDRAEVGRTYVVARVPEEDPELLRFLVDSGVLPEATIVVLEGGRYRGVLSFRTQKGTAALGYDAASRVWVYRPPDGS